MNKTIKYSGIGAAYCLCQRFGESILGFIITDARNASNVNFEGAIYFAIIGFFLSIIPYVIIYPIANGLTNNRISNSILSAGINIFIIIYFYYSGLIHKDPASFLSASIIFSILIIVAERKLSSREQKPDEKTGT